MPHSRCCPFSRRRPAAFRVIQPHHPDDPGYCTNEVTNSKYTLLNFLPKNFYEQFKRPLNRYFLLIGLLQLIPAIAPVNPVTTLGPLLLAFLITAIKEGVDDLQRHRQDSLFNRRQVTAFVGPSHAPTVVPSQDLRVGDLVQLTDGEEVPCDLLLLASSDSEGVAYIQTANIDGEIDLKPRSSLAEVARVTHSSRDVLRPGFHLSLTCEPPNREIYSFNSTVVVDDQTLSVSSQQLLLQSCILKNTEWVHGMVVYTGNETKVGMNKASPPLKWAQVDQRISQLAIFIFCFQVTLALTLGFVGYGLEVTEGPLQWYLAYGSTRVNLYWLIFPARFFLLTSVMIPVSFKVIVDISKYFVSLAIHWDLALYDEVSGLPAVAANTAIAEDLGQIEHILTDKTGTLTQNEMRFQGCAVGGRKWRVLRTPVASPKPSPPRASG
eukprot:RCo036409